MMMIKMTTNHNNRETPPKIVPARCALAPRGGVSARDLRCQRGTLRPSDRSRIDFGLGFRVRVHAVISHSGADNQSPPGSASP